MTEKEQEAFVSNILASPEFEKASERIKLFQFLLKNKERGLAGFEIEHEHFKVPIHIAKENSGHARQACRDLRRALQRFTINSPDEQWRCELPKADNKREGFQLLFNPVQRSEAAAKIFWKPHLDASSKVLVVGGSHLFFFDPNANSAFRLYDLNDDGTTEEARQRLKRERPQAYKPELMPLHDFFVSSGEIYAFEAIQRYFHEQKGILIARTISREISNKEIIASSPILIGRPITNRVIDRVMKSADAAHLGFRVDSTMGGIHISSPLAHELQDLSAFGLTKKGVLPPTPGWTTVFGLVTRLHVKGWSAPTTIVSAGFYVKALSKIIETLTDDRLAHAVLSKTGWPLEHGLPKSFEMLFAVNISPGGLEGIGEAELLACRAY